MTAADEQQDFEGGKVRCKNLLARSIKRAAAAAHHWVGADVRSVIMAQTIFKTGKDVIRRFKERKIHVCPCHGEH